MKISLLKYFHVIPFVLGISVLNAQSTESNQLLKSKIDAYLTASVANGFSGTVLVAEKGEIILSEGYGWADRKNKIPNTSFKPYFKSLTNV